MLSRFLTKVLGSRHDAHTGDHHRDGRLEARLKELQLESLEESRVLSTDLVLKIPNPINGVGILLDEQHTAALAAYDSSTISGVAALCGDGDARDDFLVTRAVTLVDGMETTRLGSALAYCMATSTRSNPKVSAHCFTASYVGDAGLTTSLSLDLGEKLHPRWTITGTETALDTEGELNVNVLSKIMNDVPIDSGALSFPAATLTSVSICQSAPSAAGDGMVQDDADFKITGTATANGVTSAVSRFLVTVALPFAGAADFAGFRSIQVSSPGDQGHSTPW